jgi:hypothetical protein
VISQLHSLQPIPLRTSLPTLTLTETIYSPIFYPLQSQQPQLQPPPLSITTSGLTNLTENQRNALASLLFVILFYFFEFHLFC